MRLLVDTHVLLWIQFEPKKLPAPILKALSSSGNEVFFSAASIWEIAIKAQLKRTHFQVQPDHIAEAAMESGLRELPIYSAIAARVAQLPTHHADPFDRLLVAQAMADSLILLTADEKLTHYSDLVKLIK